MPPKQIPAYTRIFKSKIHKDSMNYITYHVVSYMDYEVFIAKQIKLWSWTNSFISDTLLDKVDLSLGPSNKSVLLF
jgi:hypothetical protein